MFTFHHDTDLSIVGPEESRYTVEITGVSGDLNPLSKTVSFALDVCNPCIDPDFVKITTKPLPNIGYQVYQGQYEWHHDPFLVATEPI